MKAFESAGVANFELVGRVKLTDFTFKLDLTSEKSDWVRNTLNLLVDCGGGNEVQSTLSGGYGESRNNVCYVHGKKARTDAKGNPITKKDSKGNEYEVKTDDYTNMFTIAWEDRFDEEVLKEVGDGSFLKIGIKKDKDGKTYTEKFVSGYDAIAYLEQNKDKIDGKVVRVKGSIRYKVYNGNIQCEKEIKSIYLSEVEEDKFKSEFTQTVLFDKASFGKKDKETGLYDVYLNVLANMKDYDGKKIPKEYFVDKKKSANIPLAKLFYAENENIAKLFNDKRVKKGDVTEVVIIGKIVEGRAKEQVELDDLDDDMKFLVESGMYTMEQLAQTMAVKKERVSQWIIQRPLVKMVGDEDAKVPQMAIAFNKYKEDDLILTFLAEEEPEEEAVVVEEEIEDEESTDDDDWMSALQD